MAFTPLRFHYAATLIRRQIEITPFLAAFFRDDFALPPLLSASFHFRPLPPWPLYLLRHYAITDSFHYATLMPLPLPYIFIFIISRRQLSAIIIFATLPLHFADASAAYAIRQPPLRH
jgi:hypothetical protein